MGMYTEFHFNVELKQIAPLDVIFLLRAMIDGTETIVNVPNHPLFKTDRWLFMLQSDSYYFAADTCSTLRYDDIAKTHFLCIRCNLKDYCNEIENFVAWIKPYLYHNKGDFLGFSRYEETEIPDLIYM